MENSTDLLGSFHQQLNDSLQHIEQPQQFTDYVDALVSALPPLVTAAQQIGQTAHQQLSYKGKITSDTLLPFVITHHWAAQVKGYLLLWRDTLLEAQKAVIMHREQRLDDAALLRLRQQSLAQLNLASGALHTYVPQLIEQMGSETDEAKRQIATWRLQENPWSTYQMQFEQIPEQCAQLMTTQDVLLTNLETFERIKERIQHIVKQTNGDIDQAVTRATDIADYVAEYVTEKPGKIAVYLEGMEGKLHMPNHIRIFLLQLESITERLSGKIAVPTGAIGGMVQTSEINFKRATITWVESEILPVLYEVEEIGENISNGVKMAVVNIRNRVLLADKKRTSTDGSETDANSAAVIAQPLHSFIQDSEKWRTNINKLFQLIQERIDAQLQLNQIYKVGDEFLSIPLQSTINQLRQNQDDVLNSIRNWWSKRTAFISRLRRDVTKENTLTDAEKIARFIETYRPAADNPQYAGIFLTHGYVGDSFWVGRDRELTHAKKVIDQWRDGFRGSLLITGQRSAGKTLFGNTLVNRHFANQTIALAPNSTIRINGRRLKTDYQLGPALQFIRDNTLNDHPLVWIDDIELWTDTNISYAENIRQLRSYIDRYSGRMFFMVSTSNWQREHLATTMDLDQLFQAEINLDWMSLDEIQQAILIRHGATHKTLVNTEGEKTSSQDFARMTRRIYAATKGNIGNALNRWSAATERYSEDKVVRTTDYNYPLPDFINMDNGILLHAISMKKRTNDYRLRKLFGPSFNTRFNSILQRLIGMGIVKRSVDGQIEINEIAANEIARLLDKHDFLQCGQR